MENLNLAALLLTSLLAGMERAEEKGPEHSTRPAPIEARQEQADQRSVAPDAVLNAATPAPAAVPAPPPAAAEPPVEPAR